jgi:hypothetical protein
VLQGGETGEDEIPIEQIFGIGPAGYHYLHIALRNMEQNRTTEG